VDKIKQTMERIDALTIRERGMVLLAVLAVLIFVWDTFFMAPLGAEQKRMQAELDSKRAEVNALNIQLGQLLKQSQDDPNAAARAELAELREELAAIEAQIKTTVQELVDPARMPELLRNVINQTQGLTLTNLEGLGVSPLVAKDDKTGAGEDSAGDSLSAAYKHGMRIRFRGDYLQTLEYLRRLEALEWNFFWDRIEFEVKNYPRSASEIRIYTLSLTQDWIKA